jgi:hypothetical protein
MRFYRLRLALELFWFTLGLVIWPVGVAILIGGLELADGSWWKSLPIILIAPFQLFFSSRDFERLRAEKRNLDEFMKWLKHNHPDEWTRMKALEVKP